MKTLDDKVVLEKIDTSVNQLDALRVSGLRDFDDIQSVKNEISIREQKRLSEKYGKNHARVINAQTRNANYNNVAIGLESEIEKAAINSEKLEMGAWRLHGKVFDEKFQPMEGLTVYFSDEKKQWIEQLGNFCTDKAGYFTLTLSEQLIDRLKDMTIYTSVSDKNKKVLCIAKTAANIRKGKIEYIEIFIKDGGCVEPPTRGEVKPVDPEKGPETRPKEPITPTKPIEPNPTKRDGNTKPKDEKTPK